MGLRAASTSVSSSSASENVFPIHQENTVVDETNDGILSKSKSDNNIGVLHLLAVDEKKEIEIVTEVEVAKYHEKNSKLTSNASVRSNMAPALTEPLSQTNKLSSSTTSASPRPTSNSQLATTITDSTSINGDTENIIDDIETVLLRAAEVSFVNGGGGGINNNKNGNKNITGAVKVAEILQKSDNILKSENIALKKGAFQLAFEQVIAQQAKAIAEAASTSSSSSSTNPLKQKNNSTSRIINNNNTNNKRNNKVGLISKRKFNNSREKSSRQMGPMCDTNNSTKSQLLEISATQQQEKVEENINESDQHMDLSNYDNEDSQQDNVQVEINSSSSTITAENTDVEDNVNFSEDVHTIVVSNEEFQRNISQVTYDRMQRTPPRTTTITSNTIGTSQYVEQQESQQQQQQSQNHSQTVTTTPICSLTPQSTTSAGGLSLQKDFIKDSAEMDQVLGDMDLLQVLKGFDSAPGGENLCDLAGSLGLFNDVDVMNYEEMGTPIKDTETREIRNEIERRQQQMQRKCDFLLRRLRKIQARYMGRHTSEEVAGLFEWTNRIVRRKDREQSSRQILYEEDKRRPVSTASMRSFLKRLDAVATSQHSNQNSSKVVGTGQTTAASSASKLDNMAQVISAYDEKTTEDIGHISGMLQTELKEVQSGIDSDVTASSSGGESADEMVTYNNQVQQSLSIAKRAAWRWVRDRAAIAARWTWLLSQISDLEYRIRQHNELQNQIKKNKGAVTFEKVVVASSMATASASPSSPPLDNNQQQQTIVSSLPSSVNGYRGTLPGTSKAFDLDIGNPPNGAYETNNLPGACRTRPFQRAGFRKRKLLQTANVHTISKKAARPSTIKCGCQWPLHPCALCTGRSDPTAPRDLPDTMTFSERVALLDPGFHAVLSFPEDVSTSIHLEAVMRMPDWQNRIMRLPSKTLFKGAVTGTAAQQKAAERSGEDRSSSTTSNKKLMDSNRRKQNRKYAQHQDSGPAANKLKNAKARRALQHGNQFNNSHPNHHVKNSSSKHRKLSSSAGGTSGITSLDYQDGMIGSVGTNSSSGVTGSSDGGIDGNDQFNNGNIPRSKNSSPTPGNHHHHYRYESGRFDRKNRNSYDIDNIVIPYSVAATTRVEILPYKEIPTPKWRIIGENEDLVDEQQQQQQEDKTDIGDGSDNEPSKTEIRLGEDEEFEDISDLAIQIRHERALIEERRKFQTYLKFPWSTRSRANRRIDSRAESSGANTPDPTSPASNTQNAAGDHESIPSPANPSTPQTPAEMAEGSDNAFLQNPITTFLNSTHRRGERRRTVSSKKDPSKEEQRRSSSPDGRDTIPPFEPLGFPLSDEQYENMLRMMPNDHLLSSEDCSKINCDRNSTIISTKATKTTGGIDGESGDSTEGLSTTITSSSTQLNNNSGDLLSAFDTGDSLLGCDSDTDSAESGLQDEDPNDPEWREPA